MTTGLCMKIPTWNRPLLKSVRGVKVYKLILTLFWIMTGSEAKSREGERLVLA